jgi:uncharacterized integral membrane protein (TIGR00698 family)
MLKKLNLFVIPTVFLALFWFPVSSAVALVSGILIGLILGNPHLDRTRKATKKLLALSVMGLGAGMDLIEVARVGYQGIFYTVVGISATLALGFWLAKQMSLEKHVSVLISMGTAICGGSAIAALAPIIRARHEAVSVSLITVFLLNALALVIFPPIGHWASLSQHQFGLWAALAIHDTSSVVGASLQYGSEALKVATTVKLARAFWIAPVAFLLGLLVNRGKELGSVKAQRPWFILGFLLMAAFFTWRSEWRGYGNSIAAFAKQGLVATLFLIGTTFRRQSAREVGWRPFAFGVALWVVVSLTTLGLIANGVVK